MDLQADGISPVKVSYKAFLLFASLTRSSSFYLALPFFRISQVASKNLIFKLSHCGLPFQLTAHGWDRINRPFSSTYNFHLPRLSSSKNAFIPFAESKGLLCCLRQFLGFRRWAAMITYHRARGILQSLSRISKLHRPSDF